MSEKIEISVIIPVSERFDEVRALYFDYKTALEAMARPYEVVYVLDGLFPEVLEALKSLQGEGEPIRIVQLAKWFGEATALTAGFENSSGELILTLPAYYQVDPGELPALVVALDDYDMVIARRWPRTDSLLNRVQSRIFHGAVRMITGYGYKDLGSGVRLMRRRVTGEIEVYGDQHRFMPLLARSRGFRVKEVNFRQSPHDPFRRLYRPGVYLRRLLDLLTVFFLVKFTRKPLRFFGLIGSAMFILGGLLLMYLIVERLLIGAPLAERPALLLSSLMVVLGVQFFALGLIGELIIFTHASGMKEYTIDEIINPK